MKILNIDKINLKELLKNYFESNKIDKKFILQIEYLINKLTEEAKKNIVKNFNVIFYVKNENDFISRPLSSKIKNITDENKLYLYFRLIDFATNNIDIIITNANEENIEIYKLIDAVIFTMTYTKDITSFTLDLDKIDALYTKEPKKIAKGARKSIISTLTKKRKERIFRVCKNAKNRIVLFDELLEANKLDLGDKTFNCKCPICGNKYSITKFNIDSIIEINDDYVIFKCEHNNTNFYKELPFKVNIKPFLEGKKYSKYSKQMFFINNFKKLTEIRN